MRRIPLERFLSYDKIQGFTPSPRRDEVALSIDTSGQLNLWIYDINGLRRRVTPFIDERAIPVSWSWDGDKLLFNVDHGGDEIWQIYLYSRRDGWYRPLIVEEGVVHYSSRYAWAGDSNRFIFFANREDRSRFDLYLYNTFDGGEELLWIGLGGYQIPYWFYEDKILILDIRSHEDTTLYLLDIDSREATEITPHEGDVLFQPIAPYGGGFFLTSDYKYDYTYLAYYDISRRTMKVIWKGKYDVEAADVSGDYILFAVNVEGYSRLYWMDIGTRYINRVYIPQGVVDTIIGSGRGGVFYLSLTTPYRPMDIYRYEVEGEFRRLTDTFHGSIDMRDLARPEVIYYRSADDLRIHTVIYRPRGKGRHPLLVVLHGGPQSQSRVDYSPLIQYMVHRGVVVAMPNFRGSTGFGKRFRDLINRDWGGGELMDIKYFMEHISRQGWVDMDRVAVFGASFGGFLTLSCISRLPEYWRVAAEWFGPSNLVTFAKSVPPYWRRYMRKWVGDPDDPDDYKMLMERSPINYVENIRVPLLIIQGARDIRVARSESDQIVERLREKGLEVEYIVYEDEGHGFTKEKNLKDAISRTAKFILKYLEIE